MRKLEFIAQCVDQSYVMCSSHVEIVKVIPVPRLSM